MITAWIRVSTPRCTRFAGASLVVDGVAVVSDVSMGLWVCLVCVERVIVCIPRIRRWEYVRQKRGR